MTAEDARTRDDLKEQPWADVLKTLGEQLRDFIQQEMQLVKVELSSKIKQAGLGAGMFGAAGFFGVLAAGALTAAGILALALVMPAWAAALVVTGLYGLAAAVLALSGRKKIKAATPLAPEQAIRTAVAAREQVQQAWERGSNQAGPVGGGTLVEPPLGAAPETTGVAEAPADAVPAEQPAPSSGIGSSRTSFPRF
ncbi:MAG TPA: phage holin family protein [Actinomycetota bacterium]|jgi:hypothetical protein